jgi:hypothetical protein
VVEVLQGDSADPALESLADMATERCRDEAPAEIKAQIAFARAAIAQVAYGEAAFEGPSASGLALLSPDFSRWNERLEQHALFLALRGRLKEIEHLLPADEATMTLDDEDDDFSEPELGLFPALRFMDAVECGRIGDAERLIEELDADGRVSGPFEDVVAAYDSVMLLMQHHLEQRPGSRPTEAMQEELCLTMAALLDRDQRTCYRFIEEGDYTEVGTASTLFGWQSIRMALALRDVPLATELLERRQADGLGNYLDDLIRARLLLFGGQDVEAAEAFGRCLRAIDWYGAHDRIDFELGLSVELRPLQMAWLGHRVANVPPFIPPEGPLNPLTAESQVDG